MAVTGKHKRKISIGERKFYWYVKEDEDGAGKVLHVSSEDKAFLVKYQIEQPVGDEYIVVLGWEFLGAETGGCWRRFRCPRFEEDSSVSPGAVRKLIEWALGEKQDLEEVTWKGPFRL